jgi:hypothetical protein
MRELTYRMLAGAMAGAILVSTIETSNAGGATASFGQYGAAVPDGVASMLRLRVPFGGTANAPALPALTFSAGPSWRMESVPWRSLPAQHAASFEAGFSLQGAPVLRFGPIDLTRPAALRLSAAEDGEQGVPNWVWWVGGGLALTAIAVTYLASMDSSSCWPGEINERCPLDLDRF